MKCPACKIPLKRVKYENVNIHECEKCRGTLVRITSLKSIETRRENTEAKLMQELIDAAPDTKERLRCQKCLGMMEKKKREIGSARFTVDRCSRCCLIWLDAGELAKLQVIYEYSEKGEEALRFQERLKNMTPDEKREFEERIANLPEENIAHDILMGILAHSFSPRGWQTHVFSDLWDFSD